MSRNRLVSSYASFMGSNFLFTAVKKEPSWTLHSLNFVESTKLNG